MDSEVTINLRKLSQILAAVGISSYSSQGEHIFTKFNNLSTSIEIIEEPQSHELQKDSPFQSTKETENLETTFDGEEDLSTYISTNPSCTQAIEHSKEGDLPCLEKGR